MPYSALRTNVQEVVVNLDCAGQLMVEKHYLVYQTPAPTTGSSDILLNAFRAQYRAVVLLIRSNRIRVKTYIMKEVIGASAKIINPGQPDEYRRFKNTYDADKKEIAFGDGAAGDIGQVPTGDPLPLHEAMGMEKAPESYATGYFEGSYSRMGGLFKTDLAVNQPEIWGSAILTTYTTMGTTFNASRFLDTVGGTIGWRMCIFSPAYYVDKSADTGQPAYTAARPLKYWAPVPWVRTQTSRRFTTRGVIEGK